ncbi:MAG: AmmeMemoRadiSam system protein B, partial [Fibrobacterota bacterium]
SPHAGYGFSGRTAGHTYAALGSGGYETVVIIAPSHFEYFPYVSLYDGSGYEIPGDTVKIDQSLSSSLLDLGSGFIRAGSEGHFSSGDRQEHSLEVQIPFISEILPEAALVPLVMGDQSAKICRALGEKLAEVLAGKNAVIIASTDLSHFHPYDEAVGMDSTLIKFAREFDYNSILEKTASGKIEACGSGPLVSAMIAAEKLGASKAECLDYSNSGDVAGGSKDSVVGYMSLIMY